MTSRGPPTVETRMHSSARCDGSKTVKALADDHGKLELYSLPDGKPAEVAQYGVMWSNFLVPIITYLSSNLYSLEIIQQTIRQAVAVIQAIADKCVQQCFSCI